MTASLRLDAVSAGYGEVGVLERVSLEVPNGTLTALLGPSGCGKTTVLRAIAGLIPLGHGDVWLGAERLTLVPAEHRDLGVVFQKPLLFPHMSVAENVAFGLAMRRIAPAERHARVAEALEMVQLAGFGSRRPRELSGGQEQRVSLARALVMRPRVLLLDEPLTALDEHLRREIRLLLRDLQRRLAITTLFVTHDQREATDLADQVAVLLAGRLAQAGPPRVFHTDPASAAVARFFGWSVLPGVERPDGFETAGGRLAMPSRAPESAVAAAFHPDTVRVSGSDSDCHQPDTLPGTLEQVTDLGHHQRLTVRLTTGDRVEVRHGASDPPVPGTVGALVHLHLSAPAIRFFSAHQMT